MPWRQVFSLNCCGTARVMFFKCKRLFRRASATTVLVILVFTLGNVVKAYMFGNYDSNTSTGRQLLSGGPWETCGYELDHGHYVFMLPYVFLTFLCFIGLALICDDFFVPSLEAISEKLDLSEDVAGATFMAAGSSAPELFTSVAGVGVESDVGIGTIVGSAMFNILIIVALSAVLAGKTLYLDWRPLFRDSAMYGLSIVVFIGFSWDGKLTWYEALILLSLYATYIVIMKFNGRLMDLLLKVECAFCRHTRVNPDEETEDPTEADEETIHTKPKDSQHSLHKHRFIHSHKGELAGTISHRRRSTVPGLHGHPHHSGHSDHEHHSEHDAQRLPVVRISSESRPSVIHEFDKEDIGQEDKGPTQQVQVHFVDEAKSSTPVSQISEDEEDPKITLIPFLPPIKAAPPDFQEAKEGGALGWLKYIFSLILFVLSFPFLLLFTWTIPNCSTNRKWYVVTASFLMSIFWIAALSFAMVTFVSKLGCLLDIGQFTMGLVIVAIGTSVPDALSSILVARDGFGDMAVSNAIGSNVFDINLGLGLPFLIRICIDKGKEFSLLSEQQWEDYHDDLYAILPHPKFSFLLLLILFITIIVFTAFKYKLNSFVGLCFVTIYLLFLTYAFVQDTVCEDGKHC